jgi:hypothetical protein
MWPTADCGEVDGLAILVQCLRTPVALVVSEAILDADDDPRWQSGQHSAAFRALWCSAYHRLVKTTPKPNATKKSSGELVGPLLSLLLLSLWVGEGVGEEELVVAMAVYRVAV